ncbi:hypothetical protein K1T71_004589 [Dendrolimus kikuchii]|uniref:Uncharacterized protein n=1 Tax=Dendrolimus kikuchii TaxID=765133 RepID=A0ACC1D8R5_9NEOP|nr:hypothetical protein K1T71_004589 [Dendrolimus kikuchii]
MTPGLIRCVRNRDNMHKKLRKDPDNAILKLTYSRYRNFCNALIRKQKIAYEKAELEKAKNNPKATWKVIKSITNTDSPTRQPKELLELSSDLSTSLDTVNKFLVNIGKELARKITSSGTNIISTAESLHASPRDSLTILCGALQSNNNYVTHRYGSLSDRNPSEICSCYLFSNARAHTASTIILILVYPQGGSLATRRKDLNGLNEIRNFSKRFYYYRGIYLEALLLKILATGDATSDAHRITLNCRSQRQGDGRAVSEARFETSARNNLIYQEIEDLIKHKSL